MKRIYFMLIALSLLTITLAACGTNEENNNETTNEENNTQEQEEITVEGAVDDVTLDEPAKKVVALEWTYGEDLLALGVQPAGMADIEGYNEWVNIEEELDDAVEDVGTRQEPNLEAIANLEPDLIIGVKFRHEQILEDLNKIAPTVLFNPYPEDESISQYDEMETTFKEIAKAVDKEDEADQVLTDLNELYDEAASTIESSEDLDSKDFVLTQAFSGAQAPEIRVFTPNAMATVIFEKLGLTNVFEPDQFEAYGYSTVNVEALTAVEDANYFYVVQDDDNIYENELSDNKVWNDLDFVKEDRMIDLGGDTWLFGGPLSAKTLVDQITSSVSE